ncbi:hypothetical protein DS745_09435 [Anaerobacillus alkaliphilus]|uniref:Uncharacterized protein n=1 Tax=Anaerobacillus alkaliphilus TaxID=1548597 RepID=A0A4Q0VU36_9BACI|nr:hypothetical protein [Anaerobacillus alkaliphilus]RXJ01691.1 hypothetical protein DS745_09435 [Anaerobacillus alkaliphilus]
MGIYVKLVAVVCFTFFMILAGQFHWKQQANEMAVYAESQNFNKINNVMQSDRKDTSSGALKYSELILDYEDQFVNVIVNYKEAVNEQLLKAENAYFQKIIPEPNEFRNFVVFQMNEFDSIYNSSEEEYLKIYEELVTTLVDNGYSESDTFLYLLLFEEISVDTQMKFVAQLISFQE